MAMMMEESGMSSAPETEEVLFQQDNFPSTLLQNFQDMKYQEQLCNVSVLVGGRVFQAHRLVLAAVSPVFRAMFTTDMAEAKQEQIQFPEMDAGAFEEILQFAYSGKIRMSLGSVELLMSAASFLQMNTVVEFGAHFLQARIQVGNVLGIWQLADRFNCGALMEAADKLIDKYFVLLSKSADFRSLSPELLTRILMKNELFVSSENQVFEALMCWVEADPEARAEQLAALLPCVRLPLLTSEILADCVQAHPLIRDSNQCLNLLHIAMVYKLMPGRRPLIQTFQMKPRCFKDAPGLIYVVGGDVNDPLSSVGVFDPLIGHWSTIQPMSIGRSNPALAVMDGLLYVIGGSNGSKGSGCLQSVEVFDPRSGRWEEGASLNEKRNAPCAAVVDNRIFVCGGSDEANWLSSVEVLEGGRWTLTSPMHHRRNGAGVAVLDGKIYMMGGYGGGPSLDCVERLDPETMQWTMMQPMRTPRSSFGACSLNSRLFICGGLGRQNERVRSVEMYDPVKDEWKEVASLNEGRCCVPLVSHRGSLYAIGGCAAVALSSVEILNREDGVWRFGPSLPTPRSDSSCIVVPTRPEDLIL